MGTILAIVGVGIVAALVAVLVLRKRREKARQEADRIVAAEEKAQKAADTAARRRAEEEARRVAAEKARREAEIAAQREAAEKARREAEESAHRQAEEAKARQIAAERTQREANERAAAEERARQEAVAAARQRAEEEEGRRIAAEKAQREGEEKAAAEERTRQEAIAVARQRAEEEEARRIAAEKAKREADEKAATEEKARQDAEAAARRQAEEKARRVAVEKAQREADAKAAADEAARQEVEEMARQEAEEDEQEIDSEDGAPDIEGIEPIQIPRAPRKYRPTARVPPSATPRQGGSTPATREPRGERSLGIDVRLVFEKASYCRVSVLPRRTGELPAQIAVTGTDDPPAFVALQDDWYQDVVVPGLGKLLMDGIEWAGAPSEGPALRWSLGGREIYVLARHDDLSGFVNAPRLILGEEQVVLCTTAKLEEVKSAITRTESPQPVLLDSSSGIPAGWIGVRGVVPRKAVAPSTTGNILDVLCPLAEVRIALEAGIRIDRQTWLAGFPPIIRLRGDSASVDSVKIDGQDAVQGSDGSYTVPGWDAVGEHSIWCLRGSRSYAIRKGAEVWEPWNAHAWSLGETGPDQVTSRSAICGVLVRPPVGRGGRAFVVPASNPVLVGATPGQIEQCIRRTDVGSDQCVGFPDFEPVWALPADPLHCNKLHHRVLLVGTARAVAKATLQLGEGRRKLEERRLNAWCSAIRACGSKGLKTEPARSDLEELWKAYKRRARGR